MSDPLSWYYTANGERLHHLPGSGAPFWDQAVNEGGAMGLAACGQPGRYIAPGVMHRLGLPRCVRCCDSLGIPWGNGTPVNDEACQ